MEDVLHVVRQLLQSLPNKLVDVYCPPHSWYIDTPGGPLSRGTCKKCGARKQFENTLEWSKVWVKHNNDYVADIQPDYKDVIN